MIRLFILLLGCCLVATAVESEPNTWKPADHPATLERTITAFTRARRHIDLAAEVVARVVAVQVDVGDRISADEPMIELDDVPAVLQRDHIKATIATGEQALAAARLAVKSAEIEAGLRQRNAERIRPLADDGKISQEEFDTVTTAASVARVAVERAQVAVSQAEASLNEAKVQLAQAEDRIQRHHLRAPVGWLVAQRMVQPDALVGIGTPMLRLIDTETLVVEVLVTTEELAALRARDTVTIFFPRHGGRQVAAKLARLDPQYDPVTRKHRLELDLLGSEAPEAIGGLEVHVQFTLPDPHAAVLIPASYARLQGERYSVTTTDGRDLPITVLRRSTDNMLIVLPQSLGPDVTLVAPKP